MNKSLLRPTRLLCALCIAPLSPFASPGAHGAEPAVLDDAELDSVSAGYLEIGIQAEAIAAGLTPVAITATRTEVHAGIERGRRYLYSIAKAWALAYAAGDEVFTRIDAFFDTDEELVRQRVRARRVTDRRLPRRYRREAMALGWVPGSVAESELRIVRIRIVTRRPAP